jgi:hypothetical protein
MGDSSCYKLMLHYLHRRKIKTVHFQHILLQMTNKWPLFRAVCRQNVYTLPASKYNSFESELEEVLDRTPEMT